MCLETTQATWGNYEEAGCPANRLNEAGGHLWVQGMIDRQNWRAVGLNVFCAMVLSQSPSKGVTGWPGNFIFPITPTTKCTNEEIATAALFTTNLLGWTLVNDPEAIAKGGAATPEFRALPANKKFEGVIGPSKLSTSTESITCNAGTTKTATLKGEITSMTAVGKVAIAYSECKAKKGEEKEECEVNSTNTTVKGEIIANTLKGTLGKVASAEAPAEVGLVLEPETTKTLAKIASTKCNAETSVAGQLAGEIDPVSAKTAAIDVEFNTASSKQDIKSIVVGGTTVKPSLEAFAGVAAEEADSEIGLIEGEFEIA
jgi:hypothetical protein